MLRFPSSVFYKNFSKNFLDHDCNKNLFTNKNYFVYSLLKKVFCANYKLLKNFYTFARYFTTMDHLN